MDDTERVPIEIFEEAELALGERLRNFLVSAAEHSERKGPWVQATSAVFASKLLEASLSRHAKALISAAEASDRYARSLARATWALVLATGVLALLTALLLLK